MLALNASTTTTTMPYDRSADAAAASTLASGSASGSGRSTPTHGAASAAAARARHHMRSFSSEPTRFAGAPAGAGPSRSPAPFPSNVLPRRSTESHASGASSATTSAASSTRTTPNSSPAPPARPSLRTAGSSAATASSSSNLANACQSGSSTAAASEQPAPQDQASAASTAPRTVSPSAATPASSTASTPASSTASSTAPSSSRSSNASSAGGASPTQRRLSPTRTEEVDETLEKLRQAQANRRPKMMRLTPAHSSLPARSFKSPVSSDASTPTPSSVAFPAKGPQPSGANAAPLHPSSRKAVAMKQAPADESPGLLIDLSHLPSPSVTDLEGPVTTSRIAPDRHPRDRHGNPIKSSLKSPAASHFLPARADSVPSLPASMRFAKSVPTTPTVAKAVHFDSQLEHVKVFKFKQRPTAVSRDGSPEQTETETEEEKELFPFVYGRHRGNSSPDAPFRTSGSSPNSHSHASSSVNGGLAVPAEAEEQLVLRLPNFPSSTRVAVDREIFLERIYLADDLRSVKGSVQVRNMSFEKWVAVRFTLDKWATVNEVSADYAESIKDGAADRFTFSIKLNELLNWPRGAAAHETKSMFMCLRYTVGNAEYWDNNEGLNYQLDFRKRQAPSTPASTPAASAYSPSGSSVRSSFANGGSSGSSAKARIIEIARRGVHGGPRQAGFAMEDLRRELDRLKSDEEDEDRLAAAAQAESVAEGMLPFLGKGSGAGSPSMERVSPELARAYLVEKAKRKQSPPSSPGGGRGNSSPSMWSARYDFGESLRNPRNGSRTTGHGRAAALDYFSSKPSPRAQSSATSSGIPSSTTPTPNQFIVSVSSPNGQLSATSTPGASGDSPDFAHRFGMISPGLVHNVEHRPIVAPGSETSSPQTSLVVPLAAGPLPPSPSPSQLQIRTQQPQPQQAASDRFYSWPHPRHNVSPGSTPTAHGGSGSSGRENMFFEAMMQNGSPVESGSMPGTPRTPSPPADFSKGSSKAGVHSPHSSGATSPLSSTGSPRLFSPGGATSISSNDSDMTVVTPEDPHVLRLERASHGTFADEGDEATSATSSSTSSPRLRPAALNDMQELVARYCWGTDLVPGGGSLVATPGTDATVRVAPPAAPGHASHASPLASGASTPTLC